MACSTVAGGLLFIVLLAGAFVYTSTGDAARDLLVQELLVNLVLVLGLQVFIGSTGILSFGHLAFAQIAAYAAALAAIPAATKATSLPDIPFGLGDVELDPLWATAIGVLVAVAAGAVVGIAVGARRWAGGDDDHPRRAVRRRSGRQELAGADPRRGRALGGAAARRPTGGYGWPCWPR